MTATAAMVLPAQVVLAWTDPPAADGRLVNDLDLEVSCNQGDWIPRLGNGKSIPDRDRVNNVEKVILSDLSGTNLASSPSVLCVVSIFARKVNVASPQPFSLIATSPLALHRGCEGPTPRPSCIHGKATLVHESSTGSDSWCCQCDQPWLGPFCDQLPNDAMDAMSSKTALKIRPLQWDFFSMKTCGIGSYMFTLEYTGSSHLEVIASHFAGPHLWASPGHIIKDNTTNVNAGENIKFSLSSSLLGEVHRKTISAFLSDGDN